MQRKKKWLEHLSIRGAVSGRCEEKAGFFMLSIDLFLQLWRLDEPESVNSKPYIQTPNLSG